MAGDAWELIAKKIKEQLELLRYGPYASRCNDLYREYLEKTYGPENVSDLLNDDDAWLDFANTPEARELAAEFGLNAAYLPDGTIWKQFEDLVESGLAPFEPIFRDLFAVKPIPYGKIRWSDLKGRGIDTNKIRFVDGGVDLSSAFIEDTPGIPGDAENDDLENDGEIPIFLKEGRFIQIEIDLFKPKKQIVAEIDMQIELHLDEVDGFRLEESLSNTKDGPSYRGIKARGLTSDTLYLKVYHMHHDQGKSLLQITRQLFPNVAKEDPNIDPEAKRCYELVRRAYSKAVRSGLPPAT
jgi:hypothetical protein